MEVIIMNMCMIHSLETNQVLVLDKEVKQGWEGLTFPGGHVEMGESIYDSAIREAYEETGLTLHSLELRGLVHWDHPGLGKKELGFLYYSSDFSGSCLEACDEGRLFWMDLDDFIRAPGKSASMEDMLRVYLDDSLSEAMALVDEGQMTFNFY